MDGVTIGLICVGLFFVFALIGVKIAISLMATGMIGLAIMAGTNGAFSVVGSGLFSMISSYDYAVLPMFILMASIITETEMGTDLYTSAAIWLGHMKGGLAIATIVACALFAAVTAFPWASIVSVGAIALPQIANNQYSKELSLGAVGAGAELGDLIPPSSMFVTYGMVSGASIGTLLMAGIVPGIILALLYCIVIAVMCHIKPEYGPRGPKTTGMEKIKAIGNCWEILVLIFLVIGGIIIGWFTPTEAGAIGAFGAFMIAFLERRLTKQRFKNVLISTTSMVGMIYFLIASAMIMKQMIAFSTLPYVVSSLVMDLNIPPIALIIVIMIVYIILGCFVETMSMVLLTVGIFLPIIEACGFSAIWFGVIIVRMGDIGGLTPPMGMTAFFLKGLYPDTKLSTVFKGCGPFLIADAVHLALLVAFPALCEWLPQLLGYTIM